MGACVWEQEIEDVIEQSAFGETQRAKEVYRTFVSCVLFCGSFRIREIMNDGERAINLLEEQHACQVMGERQRRERPLDVCAFFCFGGQAGVVSDYECQPAGIGRHVIPNKFSELIRSPGFSFRIEYNDAVGRIQ